MNRVATRALAVLLLVAVLVGGLGFFLWEYTTQASAWIVFPGSPHVYTGNNIDCGVVTDANGTLLLDMRQDRTYSSDALLRTSTVHWLGDRDGFVEAPALSHYAAEMAGYSLVNGVYAYGETAGVARLTLLAEAQKAALEAMETTKERWRYTTTKPARFCAPCPPPPMTRTTCRIWRRIPRENTRACTSTALPRSVYIPGSIFKVVTLAAALQEIPDLQQQTFTCTGAYEMGVDKITCERAHGTQNVKDAFANSCNCAFAQISEQLGGETLAKYVEEMGITESQTFDGITTAEGNFQVDNTPVNVAWSAIGQYLDQINPCAFLTYMGAIAGGGVGVEPYLVENITVGNTTTYQASTHQTERIMDAQTAKTVQEFLRNNVETRYGPGNFGSLRVCAKTGTAEVGGDRKPNAMLSGFTTDEDYPFAFIVCVEDGGYGASTCIPIATQVLEACKQAIDQK